MNLKSRGPLLSLLASVRNEEFLQKEAKEAKVILDLMMELRIALDEFEKPWPFAFFAGFCEK
jgi:hypothetical protein